jgi:hypothetical protein
MSAAEYLSARSRYPAIFLDWWGLLAVGWVRRSYHCSFHMLPLMMLDCSHRRSFGNTKLISDVLIDVPTGAHFPHYADFLVS